MIIPPEASWVPMARTVIERVAAAEMCAPDLKRALLATRDALGLDLSQDSLHRLLATWDNPISSVKEAALVSPDPAREQEAVFVEELIFNTKRQLEFLLALFHFQCRHWEARQPLGRGGFHPAYLEDFLVEHPEYGGNYALSPVQRLLSEVGDSYHDVVHRMGFKFIVPETPDEVLREVLEEDLWNAYNRKNGLPMDNRTYQTGTSFPEIRDCHYSSSRYRNTFGGLRKAIDLLIKSTILAHPGREGGCLVPPKEVIHGVLQRSLELGRIPTEEEFGYEGGQWEAVKNGIRGAIEADLYHAIQRTTMPIPVGGSTRKRECVFVWQHLLYETEYFREYGVQIYDFWISQERLKKIIDVSRAAIRSNLERVFVKRTPLRHMVAAPPVFRLEESPEDFDDMTREELIAYVESNVLGQPFKNKKRFLSGYVREILKCTFCEEITVPPTQTHFVDGPKRSFLRLRKKAAFFRENPDIPTYMRQILYSYNQTSVETIKKRIAIFEEGGAPRELYVHFLHTNDWRRVRGVAKHLKRVEKSYRRIKAALVAREEAEVLQGDGACAEASLVPPSLENVSPEPKVEPGKAPRAEDPRQKQAKERLAELGFPFDSLPKNAREKLLPTNVLAKVEFMLERYGRVSPHLLSRGRGVIVEKMDALLADEAGKEAFERFLRERGLEDPPDYIFRTGRTLEIIREIEARGVPFTGQWAWVNASQNQRDRGVERAWMILTRTDRLADLGDAFEFDFKTVPDHLIHSHDPDSLVEYARVYRLVGQHVKSGFSMMNQYGLPISFRAELAKRLACKQKQRALSEKESYWLNGQMLASRVGEVLGGTHYRVISYRELLEEARPAEQRAVEDVLEAAVSVTPELTERSLIVILNKLREAFELKQEVRAKLRYHRLGYEDMEICTESRWRARGVLERIAFLESGKVPVTADLLYRRLEDVDELAALFDPNNLTAPQKLKWRFLRNLGCSPLWAERLTRGPVSLEKLRAKTFFLNAIELPVDVCGKSLPDPRDYEDFLDKPMAYCRRYAPRRIVQRLANKYAGERLREAFGMSWDHVQGWVEGWTTEATMWRKLEFLTGDGDLKEEVLANPDLVARYSLFSLTQLKTYVTGFRINLSHHSVEPQDRKVMIQVLLRVLHLVARISHSGIVSEKVLEATRQQLFPGRLEALLEEAREMSNRRLKQPEIVDFLTDKYALDLYGEAVELLVRPVAVGGDMIEGGGVQMGGKKPLLTRDEEYYLGVRKEDGDKGAFNELVTRNLRLPLWQAKKFLWSGLPLADLVQEGNVGLVKAVERFDPHKGIKFSTYATWWIRALIIKYVENHGRMVRLPSHVQNAISKMKKVRGRFIKENDREPSLEEIAEVMGLEVEKVEDLMELAKSSAQPNVQLDAPMNDEENDASRRGDFIGEKDDGFVEVIQIRERTEFLEEVQRILADELGASNFERSWDVFLRRFGLGEDERVWTLEELGGKWEVARERIRQLELDLLKVLRRHHELKARLLDIVNLGD